MDLKGLSEIHPQKHMCPATTTTTIKHRRYLGCSLALGSGVPHHSTREGVLHPQLSFAHVRAAEVATVGVLVAAVWVGVHLSWAVWISSRPWEKTRSNETKRQKGAWPTAHTLLPLHLNISMFYGSSRLCAIRELRITGKAERCSTLRCGKKIGRGQ